MRRIQTSDRVAHMMDHALAELEALAEVPAIYAHSLEVCGPDWADEVVAAAVSKFQGMALLALVMVEDFDDDPDVRFAANVFRGYLQFFE